MERKHVASSNVTSIGFDPNSETLEIEFKGGAVYQYYGVPAHLYEQLMGSSSVGSFVNTYIRNAFPYSLVG
ncbi:KTSC domain-containing protein [Hyphomonas sp.]|uniref:KTSC domain-containing protein n=1 Tax=Hyphomonas sp. TaxID=87 RepID=UPI00391A2128